jgi:predicted DsbA family dithiol-disulfide isomerase
VVLAHRLALASDYVTADMVEASEFPHLAQKYSVYGVPRIIINEVIHIEGAVPEDYLMSELMQVMDEKQMKKLTKDWEKHR